MKRCIAILVAGLFLVGCGVGSSNNPTGPTIPYSGAGPQLGAIEPLSIEISKAGAIYNGADSDGYPNFTFFGTLTNTSSSSVIEVDVWVTLQGCGDKEAHTEYGRTTYTLSPEETAVFSSTGTFTSCDNMKPNTIYKAAIHAGKVGSSNIEAFGVFYYNY